MNTSTRFTRANIRHAFGLIKQGSNPAATVYESIGSDFFLAPAPGWLNLGLWEGEGTQEEAPVAVRRLVEELAGDLPKGGWVLDVGNGLGAQDPVIRRVVDPSRLVALNITEFQLRAGRAALAQAAALPVVGDATRMPIRDGAIDGLISVEAAFHFSSRRRFFSEARRVLRPGGVLTMSDVSTERLPRRPREVLAGLTQLRIWGLHSTAAASAAAIRRMAEQAGFVDVTVRMCGERVIDPALRLTRRRLQGEAETPGSQRAAARFFLSQVELLRERRLIDYLLLRATAP